MNCEQARTTFLDSLDGAISAEVHRLVEDHMTSCEACRRFAEIQRVLDARLSTSIAPVSLSPGFRHALRERLEQRQISSWPESLPDIAHLAGCALGMVVLLLVVPQYSRTVLLAGAGFTAVTYFLQAVLRTSLENLEHTP